MLMRFCALLTVATALSGQQVVAPTPEQTGPPRGEDAGNYNVTDSFETGYRFAEIGGDLAKYRSDINYRNGMRLIGSSLSVDSKEGHGHLFDQILLNTQGLGNDPYQSAMLRVQKNGLYRYDLAWRLDEFYNPGVAVSGGLHFMDTRRRLQDHDLTLLPQSKIKFRAGYSRDTQTGPALASVEEFSSLGSAYPVFTNVRREWNEYRVGADNRAGRRQVLPAAPLGLLQRRFPLRRPGQLDPFVPGARRLLNARAVQPFRAVPRLESRVARRSGVDAQVLGRER